MINPIQRQQAHATRTIDGLERQLCDGRKIDRPREQPDQMEEPEFEARNRVVVARVAAVQESQELFVDEIIPQKTVVLARAGVERPREVGRIAQRGENVPRGGDDQRDQG
jgi:hypothetical protein